MWKNTPAQNTNYGKKAYYGKKLVNLSSHMLDSAEPTILKKGLNFSVDSKTIPVKSIICNIEDIIQNLNNVQQKTIRQECAVVLRKAKPPKCNITKEEERALRNMRANEDIFILKADKGGATVILDRVYYNIKMLTTSPIVESIGN